MRDATAGSAALNTLVGCARQTSVALVAVSTDSFFSLHPSFMSSCARLPGSTWGSRACSLIASSSSRMKARVTADGSRAKQGWRPLCGDTLHPRHRGCSGTTSGWSRFLTATRSACSAGPAFTSRSLALRYTIAASCRRYLLLATYFLLHTTYYLLLTAYCLLLTTYYLLLTTYSTYS